MIIEANSDELVVLDIQDEYDWAPCLYDDKLMFTRPTGHGTVEVKELSVWFWGYNYKPDNDGYEISIEIYFIEEDQIVISLINLAGDELEIESFSNEEAAFNRLKKYRELYK